MSTVKKEVAKVATMPKKAEQTNEVKATKAINLVEQLEKQLKEIQRKKKLADNRFFFLSKKENLTECIEVLNEEIAEGSFSSDKYVLKFGKRTSYRDEEHIFTISNPDILTKFINDLGAEIDKSVLKIEKELLQNII